MHTVWGRGAELTGDLLAGLALRTAEHDLGTQGQGLCGAAAPAPSQLQFILAFVTERFPDAERVDFVFDEQDQYAGRSKDLIDLNRKNPDITHRDKLGGVTFEVSHNVIPLQTADLLAYEVHRQYRRPPISADEMRWQSIQLSEEGRVSIAYLDDKAIQEWAALYPEKSG